MFTAQQDQKDTIEKMYPGRDTDIPEISTEALTDIYKEERRTAFLTGLVSGLVAVAIIRGITR